MRLYSGVHALIYRPCKGGHKLRIKEILGVLKLELQSSVWLARGLDKNNKKRKMLKTQFEKNTFDDRLC